MSDTTAPSAAEAAAEATDSAQESATNADTAAQVTPADLATAAQETATDTGQEPQTTDTTDQLPDWVRDKLAKANAEAAKYRTRAKDTEAAKAAEFEAYKQELGKKLGLIEDDQPAPDDLIAAANEQAQAARAELATYKRDAAINKAASGKVTDPDILTALLNQDESFTALDPSADDYPALVAEAVAAKIEAHPTLRAQVAASGVDTSTTRTPEAVHKITRDDLANMSASEINAAVKSGKLNHLMNQEN